MQHGFPEGKEALWSPPDVVATGWKLGWFYSHLHSATNPKAEMSAQVILVPMTPMQLPGR